MKCKSKINWSRGSGAFFHDDIILKRRYDIKGDTHILNENEESLGINVEIDTEVRFHREFGLYIRSMKFVEDDLDGFFQSLSDQLNGHDKHYTRYRTIANRASSSHSSQCASSYSRYNHFVYDGYRNFNRSGQQYPNTNTIEALSFHLKMNFVIHTKSTPTIYIVRGTDYNDHQLHFMYDSCSDQFASVRSHYQPHDQATRIYLPIFHCDALYCQPAEVPSVAREVLSNLNICV